MKGIYEKPTTYITLHVKRLEAFPTAGELCPGNSSHSN